MLLWRSRVPGVRLSEVERRLLEFWQNPPARFSRPFVRQVRIENGPGLRGIRQLVLPIGYPLTAICGRNGVGKSTALGVAALSCRPPPAWRVYWGNTRPRSSPSARAVYTFADFFHRQPGTPPLNGLRLGWVFVYLGNEFVYQQECAESRWHRVADPGRLPALTGKPEREVDFIPMSRVLPASEIAALRSAFRVAPAAAGEALTEQSLHRLTYILGRTYEEAATQFVRGLGLHRCRSGLTYSGFDMGAGESAVIALLSRLQAMPVGGLLIVEEIELGLHAEAQQRLIEVLLQICNDRRIQIICTTHSEVILDSLPRQARVLLRRSGDEHEAIDNVSTRFAVHEMAGQRQPELMIYTEDRFAAMVVEEALSGAQRSRVEIRDVGSNATLARQSVAHLRMGGNLKALSAFDGDCTQAAVEGWIRDERAERHELVPAWLILPGAGINPERWVLQELRGEAYMADLMNELSCSRADAGRHYEAMLVQLDAHDAGYILSQRTGREREECQRSVIRSVARRHPQLEPLRAQVQRMLDGQ